MNSKIFIGNLPWPVGDDALYETFREFGAIEECVVIKERDGRSKGYGFVTYADNQAATTAIEAMNGAEYEGRRINVNEATSTRRPVLAKPEKAPGGKAAPTTNEA